MNKEQIISESLRKIGIPCHMKGFPYLKEAVSMVLVNQSYAHNLTTKLYPEIGAKFVATGDRVERAIRHAIETAWDKTNPSKLREILGPQVARSKMTNGEFIATLAERIRMQLVEKAS